MTDFKNPIKKETIKAWKTTFKSSLKTFTYERNLEASTANPNNDSSSGEPYYDPVNETWVYPTGTPDNTSHELTGLLRTSVRETYSDPDLLSTDKKLTFLYDTFMSLFGSKPQTNDTVIYDGVTYRVEKANEDSIECFFHVFIRGV